MGVSRAECGGSTRNSREKVASTLRGLGDRRCTAGSRPPPTRLCVTGSRENDVESKCPGFCYLHSIRSFVLRCWWRICQYWAASGSWEKDMVVSGPDFWVCCPVRANGRPGACCIGAERWRCSRRRSGKHAALTAAQATGDPGPEANWKTLQLHWNFPRSALPATEPEARVR